MLGAGVSIGLAGTPAVGQLAITNVASRGGAIDLGWTVSTDRCIVAESSALTTGVFHYVGPVLSTAAATVTNLPPAGFYRVCRVRVVDFPDAGLLGAVRAALPVAHAPTNWLYDIDTALVTNLAASSSGIASVAGLDQLESLSGVWLDGNALSGITVTLPALSVLSCDDNPLDTLSLAGFGGLRSLSCNNTGLSRLDLTPCPSLQDLYCRFSALTGLNTSASVALRSVDCSLNLLTMLDFSACPSLQSLQCGFNLLTNLDLTLCTNLGSVACSDNAGLAHLTLRSAACTNVLCANGALSHLDLGNCPNLAVLDCSGNAIGDLSVAGHAALRSLTCDGNGLSSLVLAGCGGLKVLSCSGNLLASLDVGGCGVLEYVYADNNLISDLSAFAAQPHHFSEISLTGNPYLGDISPLISLASDGWLVGCKVYLSGGTIPAAQITALQTPSYAVDVIYNPYGP